MNNYKTKADYWYHKLMRTPANYQALATYRFKKWEHYRELARQTAFDHMGGRKLGD